MSSNLGIPRGTRDFGPDVMVKRNFILSTVKSVFKKYGFMPLETPSMENLSVLMGKYGDEGDQLLFKILNSGNYLSDTTPHDYQEGAKAMLRKVSEKGLRYDLTVPFARYVVMHRHEITYPFKRYQIQPVWRADRPQKGRYREFYQCDADVIGTKSLICEAEIAAMIQEVFSILKIDDYRIKINNRKILAGITEAIGAIGKETEFCVAIDKLDKIGLEKVLAELSEKNFSGEALERLQPILSLSGSNDEKIRALETLLHDSKTAASGISEVKEVLGYLKHLNIDESKVEIDLTLARGLAYYTGAIFEVKVNNVQIGSVSGGGRYDNLTGVFGLPDISGVGISFGVDRIYDVMETLDLFPASNQEITKVLFAYLDEIAAKYSLGIMMKLRAENIPCEIYPETSKLKRQFQYAEKKSIPYVVLIGPEEMQSGKFSIKDLRSGEQLKLTTEEIISILKR